VSPDAIMAVSGSAGETRRTQMSEASLDRYVPSVAIGWEEEAGSQSWREVDATLCFIDISGFTSLSERLARRGRIGAEELTDVLNHVFGNMLEVTYMNGGNLLKFGGDALLLIFRDREHEIRAASAAVEMRRVLKEAENYETSVGRLRLRMSVGIHSGQMHLFKVSAVHDELLIAGPGASVATAMEMTADAGEIVVSEATRDALPPGSISGAKGPGWLLRWRTPRCVPDPIEERQLADPARVGRWLPQTLRSYLGAGRPEPEHRIANVAFIKFSGLDEILAEQGPERASEHLQQTISLIQQAALDGGVTFLATDINEDGGKVILVSGVPIAQDEDESRLLKVLRSIADSAGELKVHIGVNQGHVFAGEIGTSYRATYTIIGDTVNLAARLAAAAPASSIYATTRVLDNSGILFESEPIEPFHVKGKEELVQAYSVGREIGEREVETEGELPFAGRHDELNQITRAIWDTLDGTGSVLTILGDVGSGKSRLIREACLICSDVHTITIRSESYGSSTPYRPVRDVFRSLLHIERADQTAMGAALRERVTELAPDLLEFLPFIGDVTHIEVPSTETVDAIEPRFRQDRLADTAIAILDSVLDRSTVFDLDDAQWMDDATAHLMGRIAEATSSRPWTVLASRRRGEGGFTPPIGRVIELGGLTIEEAESLVIDATAAAPLRPHEVAAVVARAGGNPLFLHEILQVVRDTGSVEQLPESLGSVVSTSIDALPPLSRSILRYCSVLGRSFRTSILQEVLAEEDLEFDNPTKRSLRRFLASDGKGRLRFTNAMIRDVAYDGLSYRRRRELHLRAARVFERSTDEPEGLADLLSLHYSIGGDAERAWHYSRIAGGQARAAYANVDAAAHYMRALESARRLDEVTDLERAKLWTQLGDVREQAGLFQAALDAYRRAYNLESDPMARAELMLKRASARERAAQFSIALRDATGARRLVKDQSSPLADSIQARAAAFHAMVRMRQGRPTETLLTAREAAEQAKKAGEKVALARAYGSMAWAHLMLDQPGSQQLWLDALALYEEAGDLGGQGYMNSNLGGLAYLEGRWDEALEYYERSRTAAERLGNTVDVGVTEGNIGEVLVKQNRFDEAEPQLIRAARVAQASGDAYTVVFANLQLARILIERGSYQEAEDLLADLRHKALSLDMKQPAFEAAILLADVKARNGDSDGALGMLEEAELDAREEASIFAPTANRVRALALASAGRVHEAVRVAGAALENARARHLDYEVAMLLLCKADLLDSEDPGEAFPLREEGNRIIERLDIRPLEEA
jgi:class 3 adenylate cyclase/tetratricopeptide (TPR) repeat protein